MLQRRYWGSLWSLTSIYRGSGTGARLHKETLYCLPCCMAICHKLSHAQWRLGGRRDYCYWLQFLNTPRILRMFHTGSHPLYPWQQKSHGNNGKSEIHGNISAVAKELWLPINGNAALGRLYPQRLKCYREVAVGGDRSHRCCDGLLFVEDGIPGAAPMRHRRSSQRTCRHPRRSGLSMTRPPNRTQTEYQAGECPAPEDSHNPRPSTAGAKHAVMHPFGGIWVIF